MKTNPLIAFIARRVLVSILLLFILSFLVFSLLYLAPGDAVAALLGTKPRTAETVEILRAKYHLDDPFLTQYWYWLQGALRLDFGESIQSGLPVSQEIFTRLPVTAFLGLYAFVLEMVFGLSIGIISALKQQSILDRSLVAFTVVGLSTPAFVAGVFVLYLFAIILGWFPAFGIGAGFWDRLYHLTLPAVAVAIVGSAFIVKHSRAAVTAAVDQDFVLFARARGLSRTAVLFKYILRNAMIPILGALVIVLTFLLVGSVFVEVTFSIAGLGQLVVKAANTQDLPLIQGMALFIAVLVMGFNLVGDLLYFAVDPRVRRRALK